MSNPTESRDQNRRAVRKKTELSFSITALGLILLVTPLINAFTIFDGSPSVLSLLIYMFGIWAALIFGAFIVSRALVSEVNGD